MIGYKNITLTSGLWLKCSNHCGDIMRMCIYIYIYVEWTYHQQNGHLIEIDVGVPKQIETCSRVS